MACQLSKIVLGLAALMGPGALAAPVAQVKVVTTVVVEAYGQPGPTAAAASPASPPPPPSPTPYTPTPSPAPNTPSGGNAPSGGSAPSGGKAGISYNDVSAANSYPDASWAYNWQATSGGLQGKTFVPMLHDQSQLGGWISASQGADSCLSFNEPDQSSGAGGSSMDPGTAASLYKSTFMKGGCKNLGAPAVSSQAAPGMGLSWLSSFMGVCGDCKIDFVPVHWYGSKGQDQMFKDFVTQAHQQTGKPIWVDEFSLYQGSADQDIADFISNASKWMDGQSFVQKYSPIKGGSWSTEISASSAVGQAYKSA